MSDDAIVDSELEALMAPLQRYQSLLLAVSGGCDSCALLLLVSRWASAIGSQGPTICVATVDHQLRTGSADEALHVAGLCKDLGLSHVMQVWNGEKPATGLQAMAREARYQLLVDIVQGQRMVRPTAIVTAHTQDDQAETVFMRLVRGSGVDGLGAMRSEAAVPSSTTSDVRLLRPLLGVPRSRLKATLEKAGVPWVDDPSNSNDKFERVRVRQGLPALAELGVTVPVLARTAMRAERSRLALESLAEGFVADAVEHHAGAFARLSRTAFQALSDDIQIRVLQRLLAQHGGTAPLAGLSQVEAVHYRLQAGDVSGVTLGGCLIVASPKWLDVFREPGRWGLGVMDIRPGKQVVWDRRFAFSIVAPDDDWQIANRSPQGLQIEALGAAGHHALRMADEDLPCLKLPTRAVIALPMLCHHEAILAVPAVDSGAAATGARASSQAGSATAIWQNLTMTKAGLAHFNGQNCCKMRFVGADKVASI